MNMMLLWGHRPGTIARATSSIIATPEALSSSPVEAPLAHTEMIEMGGDDDPLVRTLASPPRKSAPTFVRGTSPRLLTRDRLDVSAFKQRGQSSSPRNCPNQVGNRLLSRHSTSTAEFGRRKHTPPPERRRSLLGLRTADCAGNGWADTSQPVRQCTRPTKTSGARPAYPAAPRDQSLRSLPPSYFFFFLADPMRLSYLVPSSSRQNREFATPSPIVWHITHGLGKGSLHGGVFCLASHGSKCRP